MLLCTYVLISIREVTFLLLS
uniref:Uncharacterized protein n=1 Tax=Rhizophora mucronata TaxID=61149 RepID=A0A2P2PWJ6_RHIMU